MAITLSRTTFNGYIDDTGAGLDGTIVTKAVIVAALLDPIDAALAALPVNGTSLTAHGVVIGNGTGAVAVTSAGTAGQVLTSGGASADPTFVTPVLIGEATLADGATPALNAALGSVFRLAAGGDRTIAVPSNPVAGQKIIIEHYASGAIRTLSLNTGTGGFRYGTDITALTATASGKTDYIGAIYNSTDNKWDVVAVRKGY